MSTRNPYPSDVSDEEWAFVAPYLTLLPEDAGQRHYELREVLNGLRWMVRTGATWRMMPHDLPPWYAVYQQTQRWLPQAVLKPSCKTCASCCAASKDAKGNRALPSSIAEPCNRRQKVAIGLAT